MRFLDKNGIEVDEQTVSFYQTAKPAGDHCELQRLPSPTFVLSNSPAATKTTVPTYWNSLSKTSRHVSTSMRGPALQSSHDLTSSFSRPELAAETANGIKVTPPLLLHSEPFYTVVSLEGTTSLRTTAARSYLIDFDNVHSSVFDQQRFENCPLFEETSNAATFLSRPTLLAVTSGAVACETKKTVPAAPIAMRDNLLYRLQRILAKQRKPMLNLLLPLCLLIVIMLLIYSFRDTAKGVLLWIETQNTWIIFVIFLCMFIIVSFPVTVGYLVLIIASGYLFGFIRGLLTVMIGANLGVAIAHNTIKSLQSKLPIHKLIKNETGRAILRVISGPRAFKIVLFARLTPIPFGLQNTIFGLSSVNTRSYHAGTIIGLLPAQTINVYLGSKLRSIHEVLNDHNAALGLAGYGVFVIEVIVGAALMIWVIQKARLELSAALLATTDVNSDEKILIEIEA